MIKNDQNVMEYWFVRTKWIEWCLFSFISEISPDNSFNHQIINIL